MCEDRIGPEGRKAMGRTEVYKKPASFVIQLNTGSCSFGGSFEFKRGRAKVAIEGPTTAVSLEQTFPSFGSEEAEEFFKKVDRHAEDMLGAKGLGDLIRKLRNAMLSLIPERTDSDPESGTDPGSEEGGQ